MTNKLECRNSLAGKALKTKAEPHVNRYARVGKCWFTQKVRVLEELSGSGTISGEHGQVMFWVGALPQTWVWQSSCRREENLSKNVMLWRDFTVKLKGETSCQGELKAFRSYIKYTEISLINIFRLSLFWDFLYSIQRYSLQNESMALFVLFNIFTSSALSPFLLYTNPPFGQTPCE